MDWNYYQKKNHILDRKYISTVYIYIYKQAVVHYLRYTKIGFHNEIEFAYFGVYNSWQISNYNVKTDLSF